MILDTADREQMIVWHAPPHEDHPIFLYFHGNGGSLRCGGALSCAYS